MLKPVLVLASVLFMGHSAFAELVTRAVEYRHGETVLEGYLAYDDAVEGDRPGVLVVHEWWGLNDYIRRRTEQLARLGYVAFALDMYGKGIVTDDTGRAAELAGQVQPMLRERVRAGFDVLARHELVNRDRIAAIGYCFGGTTVLQLAYSGVDLAGVVSFHGSLPPPAPDDIPGIRARLLVLHGAADPLVPDAQVAAFQRSLHGTRVDWQLISYGGAVHSFTNPDADKVGIEGVAYDETAERRSWAHMRVFFDELFERREAPKN